MTQYVNDKYGADPSKTKDFGRVINANHVNRIERLVAGTQGKVIRAGAADPDAHYIPPTLVQDAQVGEPLLKEEIFGPVLPVVTVDNMDDAVNKVLSNMV